MKTRDITIYRPDSRQTFTIGGRLIVDGKETSLIVRKITAFLPLVWITVSDNESVTRLFYFGFKYIKTSYANLQRK